MEKFFEHNFNIDKIILALYIPLGQGERVHPNRASHGLALHTSGIRDYIFSGGKTIRTEKTTLFLCRNIRIMLLKRGARETATQ